MCGDVGRCGEIWPLSEDRARDSSGRLPRRSRDACGRLSETPHIRPTQDRDPNHCLLRPPCQTLSRLSGRPTQTCECTGQLAPCHRHPECLGKHMCAPLPRGSASFVERARHFARALMARDLPQPRERHKLLSDGLSPGRRRSER